MVTELLACGLAAGLLVTSPAAGAHVRGTECVRLTFDRPVAGGGPYRVDVTSDSGESWTTGPVYVDGTVVTASLRKAPRPGKYHVSYAVTPPSGAAFVGSYRFTVGDSPLAPVWAWLGVLALCGGAVLVALRLARR